MRYEIAHAHALTFFVVPSTDFLDNLGMNWVTVATFDNPVAAEIAKNLLIDHDVRAMIADEEIVATNWSLSNAIGGIKLLVPSESLARAEYLLDHKQPTITDEEIAEAVATSPEIAVKAAGPAEPFDDTPTDREVNSALNATAFALLFPPAQLYTLFRVWMLRYADPPVRPRDRWKVRLAYALSTPLWAIVIIPTALLLGRYLEEHSVTSWRNERFGIGDGVALTIDLPGPYGVDIQDRWTQLGPVQIRSFGVSKDDLTFWVRIFSLPKELTPVDPAAALKTFVEHEIRDTGFKIQSTTPTTIDGRAGTEVVLSGGAVSWLNKVVLVDRHFVVISVDAPNAKLKGPDAERFFKSAKIR